MEVFCTVHEALSTAALHENLDLELSPRFVPPLTRWLTEIVWDEELPPAAELHRRVVGPLIHQAEIDLGQQVAQLASDRLRLDNDAPSVKQQAESLGVTRARVYQLLEDCAKVMDVRWPEGPVAAGTVGGQIPGCRRPDNWPAAWTSRPVLPGRTARPAYADRQGCRPAGVTLPLVVPPLRWLPRLRCSPRSSLRWVDSPADSMYTCVHAF